MLRALPFDFRHDPAVYNVADQFMFGPAFLVNPITRPMYYTRNSVPLTDVDKHAIGLLARRNGLV